MSRWEVCLMPFLNNGSGQVWRNPGSSNLVIDRDEGHGGAAKLDLWLTISYSPTLIRLHSWWRGVLSAKAGTEASANDNLSQIHMIRLTSSHINSHACWKLCPDLCLQKSLISLLRWGICR